MTSFPVLSKLDLFSKMPFSYQVLPFSTVTAATSFVVAVTLNLRFCGQREYTTVNF